MSPRLSSKYGWRIHPIKRFSKYHTGIDLAAPRGATVRAISSGRVVFADPYAGYGNLIVIQHSGGLTSHYAHLDRIKVKPGQRVNAGQLIGNVGSSGHSTGPHLHLEIRVNGSAVDPMQALPGLASKAQG